MRYDPAFTKGRPPLAGMIVVSGRVRIDNLPENPNANKVEQYYGTDASKFDGYSPVHHIDKNSVRPSSPGRSSKIPLIDVYCAELVARLAAGETEGASDDVVARP